VQVFKGFKAFVGYVVTSTHRMSNRKDRAISARNVSRRREKKKRLRRDDNEGYRGVTSGLTSEPNKSYNTPFVF